MARQASEILNDIINRLPASFDKSPHSVIANILMSVAAELSVQEERIEELINLNALTPPTVQQIASEVWNTPVGPTLSLGWGPSLLPGIVSGMLQDRAVEEMNEAGDEAPADPPPAKPTRKSMAYWSE